MRAEEATRIDDSSDRYELESATEFEHEHEILCKGDN